MPSLLRRLNFAQITQWFTLPVMLAASSASATHSTPAGRTDASSVPVQAQPLARLPYPLVRQHMLETICDCKMGRAKERMQAKLGAALASKELWELRSDLYSLLATEFSQSIASQRVNALLPYFAGWVPEHKLKPIG